MSSWNVKGNSLRKLYIVRNMSAFSFPTSYHPLAHYFTYGCLYSRGPASPLPLVLHSDAEAIRESVPEDHLQTPPAASPGGIPKNLGMHLRMQLGPKLGLQSEIQIPGAVPDLPNQGRQSPQFHKGR